MSSKKQDPLKNFQLGVVPIQPDLFLSGGVRYVDILKWSFVYTYAKAIELLTNPFQRMEDKAFPFNVTLLTFEKTLTPIMDDEFRAHIAKINEKFSERYPNGKFWFDTAYGLKHLEAMMGLLQRRGILSTEPPKYQLEMMPDEIIDTVLGSEEG